MNAGGQQHDADVPKVLIVEDEGMVAMALEDLLVDLGCQPIGPAARVGEALHLLEVSEVQAAILDINIAGEKVFPVADKLAELGIPFAFATGYGAAGVTARHQDRLTLQKPYRSEALLSVLQKLLPLRGAFGDGRRSI